MKTNTYMINNTKQGNSYAHLLTMMMNINRTTLSIFETWNNYIVPLLGNISNRKKRGLIRGSFIYSSIKDIDSYFKSLNTPLTILETASLINTEMDRIKSKIIEAKPDIDKIIDSYFKVNFIDLKDTPNYKSMNSVIQGKSNSLVYTSFAELGLLNVDNYYDLEDVDPYAPAKILAASNNSIVNKSTHYHHHPKILHITSSISLEEILYSSKISNSEFVGHYVFIIDNNGPIEIEIANIGYRDGLVIDFNTPDLSTIVNVIASYPYTIDGASHYVLQERNTRLVYHQNTDDFKIIGVAHD